MKFYKKNIPKGIIFSSSTSMFFNKIFLIFSNSSSILPAYSNFTIAMKAISLHSCIIMSAFSPLEDLGIQQYYSMYCLVF